MRRFVDGVAGTLSKRSNAVLMYHSVGHRDDVYGNVTPGRLRRHVEYLTRRFDVVDLPAVLTTDTERKRVALTFDDGFANFHTNALPILREYEVPATVFVTTGFVDDASPELLDARLGPDGYSSELMLSAAQVERLVDEELVTVGNHTATHPDLTTVEDADRLEAEIVGAKAELERRFDVTVDRFAYPYGPYDERSLELVRDSHRLAVTGVPRLVADDANRYELPRLPAHTTRLRMRWRLSEVRESAKRSLGRAAAGPGVPNR
ncbi:polysaccharide deacetylase family protein [Halogeometricum sp. CBA1124]|uniref:polysaccharide deacetylase family protein n=1 Tax=Halogeometricum sp. CBA1124 TaxID=2668071 RepID=UPI00142B6421|nr:polysaccharide deacetylase family protein [Halogeometricum sp. CBA1124]MUV57113.1 polysaccharide deacetylase family protein [Halogeometricum sp. CBA1124]